MFYLVMPMEQGESVTDDPPLPTATHFPEPLEEVLSKQPEGTPTVGSGQLKGRQEEVESVGRLQPTRQSRIIQNVDEIFHTIEGLMSKLRQLKASLSFLALRGMLVALLALFLLFGHECSDSSTGNRGSPPQAFENPQRFTRQPRVRGSTVSLGNGLQDTVSGPRLDQQ